MNRLWHIANILFAGVLVSACTATKQVRRLVDGQVRILIPAPRGSRNGATAVNVLLDTVLLPGEQKTELLELCGQRLEAAELLERALSDAGFTLNFTTRIDDGAARWFGLRMRRGNLYGDINSESDSSESCRVYLVRVQLVQSGESPVPWLTPWAEPYVPCKWANSDEKNFPFPPNVYPTESANPACKSFVPSKSFYRKLPGFQTEIPTQPKPPKDAK